MAAPTQKTNGPIDISDVQDWKNRFNEVLAKPSERIKSCSPETAQSWTNSLFGCFSPIDLCLLTWCLPCVTFGKTHHRIRKNPDLEGYEPINTSCLLFCGSACVGLPWIPVAMQRADIRERYNLQGNCLTDISTSFFCGCCTLVQQEKEAAQREPLRQAYDDKQPYKPSADMEYNAVSNENI